MADRVLLAAARDSEDIATGLQSFRDILPKEHASITAIIGKLYQISSSFSKLDDASQHPQYELSFLRIKREVLHVVLSSRSTSKMMLDMFGRTKSLSYSRVWDDLNYRMSNGEGVTLHERLDWYCDMLYDCVRTLKGLPCPDKNAIHAKIVELLHAQQPMHVRSPVESPYVYAEVQASPSSDGPRPSYPWAPEPPVSPTFSSSSGQTYNSSHTSYSVYGLNVTPASSHWAKDVFDGVYPGSKFRKEFRNVEDSRCEGEVMPDALHRLQQDGFIQALELPFDDGQVMVRLYHRASDSRARILFSAGGNAIYCAPLTRLKAVRDRSCLKLCFVLVDGEHTIHRLWANLCFASFERMCLFYSTFVAMKRQDNSKLPKALLEDDELDEDVLFSGMVRDEDMLHRLRLFRDQGSGALRLEATPLRGPMASVPLWTSFITRYKIKGDKDWAHYMRDGVVSLVALKPAPYVFLLEYKPPRRGSEWLLQFDDPKSEFESIADDSELTMGRGQRICLNMGWTMQ
ncbi:hypothetical protein AMS68_001305 [Peltaster fructicola]|uniref:Uncharacterized protein n=1 Tax=Peltaster fructicola TaxID=286661 RepID=A0A6H0XME1_9PEZI|nr:hypothetical protein AMS68_001305 [Peltaster fructicola]